MSKLEIKDLRVSVETEDGPKEILKGVTLTIGDGETHAIMGPTDRGSRRSPTRSPATPSTRSPREPSLSTARTSST